MVLRYYRGVVGVSKRQRDSKLGSLLASFDINFFSTVSSHFLVIMHKLGSSC